MSPVKRTSIIAALALLAATMSSCQVPDATRPVPSITQPKPLRVSYSNNHWQFADVYKGPRKQAGVIVFVHGGAWMSGGTSWGEIPSWIRTQSSAGWAIASVSYRLGAPHVLDGMVEDVVLAVEYFRNSKTYRGLPIYIAGHSAGGTLALRASLSTPGVSGLILAATPLELRPLAFSDASTFGYTLPRIVNNALGCPRSTEDKNTCPEEVLSKYDLTSSQIASLPPLYIAAGVNDEVISHAWSQAWYEKIVSIRGDGLVWLDSVEQAYHSLDGANHEALGQFLRLFARR